MNDDWKMICFACGALWDERPERGVVKGADGIACTGNVLPRTHCPKCGEPEDIGIKDGGNHGLIHDLIGMEIRQIGFLRYVENDESAQIVDEEGDFIEWLKEDAMIAMLEQKS